MAIAAYLNLRTKSVFRQLMEFGVIGISLLLIFFYQLFRRELYSNNNLLYWAIAILCFLTEIHIKRKDKDFIKMYFNNRFFVFFIEYTLLFVPFLIPLLCYSAYWHIVIIIASIVIISIVPAKLGKTTAIPTIFPSLSLDWKDGFRRYYLLYILLFMATLIGGFSDNLTLVQVVIYIAMILASDFNTSFEPKYYLLQHSGKPSKILFNIIRASLISFLIFNSLYLISLFIFSSYDVRLLFKTLALVVSLHLILILLKYTVYRTVNDIIYGLVKILFIAISIISFYVGHLEYLLLIPFLFFLSVKRITKIVV